MALTKITRGVIKANENYDTHNINSTGIVTAVSANFTGDVSIGGTLTYQDVTNIDSVGIITAQAGIRVTGGRVLVGTTDAGSNGTADDLVVANNSSASDQAGISIRGGTSGRSQIFFSDGTSGQDEYRGMLRYDHSDNSMQFRTDAAERLRIDGNGTTKFKGPLTEKCNRDTGAGLSGDYNHDLITYGNVHWATSTSSGTWTYNLRGSATVALNDMMTDGETLSFQLISAQNSTSNYMTAFKIDGSSSHTVWWQGGSAPSEGGGSGYDVYTFTVFKIGNASFRTFASLSNHA